MDQPPAPELSTAPGEPQVIALVDDDRNILTTVSLALQSEGFATRLYSDGAAALKALLENPPDLAVCDIKMPRMDGFELLRQLRARSALPLIFLTSKDEEPDEALGLELGADDYITKPFEEPELVARVATHTELALMRQIVIDEAQGKAEHLERALASNRTIGTAIGILMSQQRVTSDAAFALLREHSQNSNRRLREIAEDVVLTGALPE